MGKKVVLLALSGIAALVMFFLWFKMPQEITSAVAPGPATVNAAAQKANELLRDFQAGDICNLVSRNDRMPASALSLIDPEAFRELGA